MRRSAVEMDVYSTGVAPLFLNLTKAYRANLSGSGDMGTATGLKVDPGVILADLHQPHLGRCRRWGDRQCLDQIRSGLQFFLGNPMIGNW